MKKNLVSIVVIVVLFGALTIVALGSKSSTPAAVDVSAKSADAAVKICPHSGQPCTEDPENCDSEGEDCL